MPDCACARWRESSVPAAGPALARHLPDLASDTAPDRSRARRPRASGASVVRRGLFRIASGTSSAVATVRMSLASSPPSGKRSTPASPCLTIVPTISVVRLADPATRYSSAEATAYRVVMRTRAMTSAALPRSRRSAPSGRIGGRSGAGRSAAAAWRPSVSRSTPGARSTRSAGTPKWSATSRASCSSAGSSWQGSRAASVCPGAASWQRRIATADSRSPVTSATSPRAPASLTRSRSHPEICVARRSMSMSISGRQGCG